jgi:PqqA peptide cyclase
MNIRDALKTGSAIFRAKFLGAKIPLVASIIPTNRCNLRCAYCGRWERPGPELSENQWLGIVDELAKLGCVQLSITGGEPLLYKGLKNILHTAKKNGIRTNLNTNGVFVPKHRGTIAMVDAVTISLDGTRLVHDAVRGEGTYDSALLAAKIAREMNKETKFYTVLSRKNLDVLDQVAFTAKDLGAKAFYQPGTYYDFDGLKKNPEAPEADDYRKAVDRLIALKRQGYPLGNSLAGLRYIRQWPSKAPIKCNGGRLFIRIEADGNVRICGRDGSQHQNSVLDGVKTAMDRLPEPTCESCWSAGRVEFNLLSNANLGAIFSYLRR